MRSTRRCPEYCVNLVAQSLNDENKSVRGSKILMLGVAYKNNVADTRESPAIDIMKLLESRGAEVSYSDPFVETLREGDRVYEGVELSPAALANADCVVVTCRHEGVDFDYVAKHAKVIVDTRNAYSYDRAPVEGARIVKL